jgi:hypothetical protein
VRSVVSVIDTERNEKVVDVPVGKLRWGWRSREAGSSFRDRRSLVAETTGWVGEPQCFSCTAAGPGREAVSERLG